MSDQELRMWTLYDHPSDYPNCWVAREWIIEAGDMRPGPAFMVSGDREKIDRHLTNLGWVFLPRQPDDDPVVAGVYL